MALVTRTTNLQGWGGNKPHDPAEGTMEGRDHSWAIWDGGLIPPVPYMIRFLGLQLCLINGKTTLVLLIKACLKALWHCASLMEPLCPCPEMTAAHRSARARPLGKAYLGEPLHILGECAHSLPLVVLQQLQDGWVHCIVRRDRPEEIRVFLLIG